MNILLDKDNIYKAFQSLKHDIQHQQPLIHAMMNHVALYPTAQMIQGFGAKPTMSDDAHDMLAISQKANAHCLNLGMMTPNREKAIDILIQQQKAPILLDCVMVHLYPKRLKIAQKLSQYATIIKGNSDEISALNPNYSDKIIITTGKQDIITYQEQDYILDYGDDMMANIVTLGCSIGAFLSMVLAISKGESLIQRVVASMIAIGIAGQITAQNHASPFGFLNQWQHNLYTLNKINFYQLYQGIKIEN